MMNQANPIRRFLVAAFAVFALSFSSLTLHAQAQSTLSPELNAAIATAVAAGDGDAIVALATAYPILAAAIAERAITEALPLVTTNPTFAAQIALGVSRVAESLKSTNPAAAASIATGAQTLIAFPPGQPQTVADLVTSVKGITTPILR